MFPEYYNDVASPWHYDEFWNVTKVMINEVITWYTLWLWYTAMYIYKTTQ